MIAPTQTVLPGHDMPPTWLAACLAYRAVRQTGAGDQTAWEAARATVLQQFPTISVRTAGEQASDALGYASVHHSEWFWRRPVATSPEMQSLRTE